MPCICQPLTNLDTTLFEEPRKVNAAIKDYAKMLQADSMVTNFYAKIGTMGMAVLQNALGGLPVRNFSAGQMVNVSTGEMKVIYSQPQGTNGSLLTTAGGLVFFGDLNRRFRALDAEDGKVLWESVVGGMVVTSTITYAVNGKQYVMLFTGEGQSLTTNVLALTKTVMPAPVRNANGIYVFALP